MLFCTARKRDSLACVTSVEERDAFEKGGGGLAWKQSLSSFFPLFLFAVVCFPFSRRNSVKLQSPNYPASSWINNNNMEEERAQKNPVTTATHNWAPNKHFCNTHTRTHTHNTQMCRRWKMPPATVAAATQKKRNSEHKVSKEKSRVEFSWEPA